MHARESARRRDAACCCLQVGCLLSLSDRTCVCVCVCVFVCVCVCVCCVCVDVLCVCSCPEGILNYTLTPTHQHTDETTGHSVLEIVLLSL